MAQPLTYSTTTAMTGAPQTLTLFTASAAPNSLRLTDLTIENSSATAVLVQIQVNGVTVDQYLVGSATPIQLDEFGQFPTATGGQVIAAVLPAGTGNITINATASQGVGVQ